MYKLSSVVPMITPMNNSKPLVIRYEINIKLKNRMHILFRFSVKIFSLHRETDTYLKSQKFRRQLTALSQNHFCQPSALEAKCFGHEV